MTNLPSTTDPRLRAATAEQATRQLQLLFSNLPVKGGESPQAVMAGYLLAVESYPLWAIEAAIKAFLRHEVPGQSKSFCPRAPELSAAVSPPPSLQALRHSSRTSTPDRSVISFLVCIESSRK